MPIFDTYVKCPLRFYDSLMKQNRFKKKCKESVEEKFKLITPLNEILPFQIKKAATGATCARFYVVNNETGGVQNLDETLVELFETADFDYLVYDGSPIVSSLQCNHYYTVIVEDSDGGEWFSELFYQVSAEKTCYLKLEWTNACDFGGAYYQDGFVNRLYFDMEIEVIERDPKILKEGKENGAREIEYDFQKYTPIFSIQTKLMPDYLLDALAFMILHDEVTLTLKQSLGAGEIKHITITPKWEFDSCYSTALLKFEVDSVLKDNCCGNEEVPIILEICEADSYHEVSQFYDFGSHPTGYTITIQSILIDGVEQLAAPVILHLTAANTLYELGLDEELHIVNIIDILNANVPTGWHFYDDMRVIERPSGVPFVIEIDAEIDDLAPDVHNYTYNEDGFSYDGDTEWTYTCI